jgi:hypothetical protein
MKEPNIEMSKMTPHGTIVKPVIYGGLLMALAVLTAATIRKRVRGAQSAESLVACCERALGRLGERAAATIG